ncbi:carbamoyl-phosphate synthase small chain [Streptomyces narbonensis]
MRVGIFSGEAWTGVRDEAPSPRCRSSPNEGANLSAEAATKETYIVPAIGTQKFTVAAVDLGIKGMTPHRMAERGIEVHAPPATATAEDIYAVNPDGVFFSNGPGDPATANGPVAVMRAVLERKTRSSASASATRSSVAPSASAPTS